MSEIDNFQIQFLFCSGKQLITRKKIDRIFFLVMYNLKGSFLEIWWTVPLARVLFTKITELYNVFMLFWLPLLKYICILFIQISVQVISLETDLLTLGWK